MPASIQIIEDDGALSSLLSYNLEKSGFQVRHASCGDDGLADIRTHLPDLVLLDWMLPDMDGVDIARHLRAEKSTRNLPIIMLTARGAESDRVRGLEVGADDYVTKPFSVRELTSRIKAQLRRANFTFDEELEFGDISINLTNNRVTRGKRLVHLGPKEFALLKLLTARPGRVFSREMILDQIWGIDDDVEIRTVDVTIGRLRRALKRGKEADPIRTVRGAGYAWDEMFGQAALAAKS